MELRVQRFSSDSESTIGLMFVNDVFECFTLEDQFSYVKTTGETRIPAGVYTVAFREVDSPLTDKYRLQYPWFEYHLQLHNVPGFENVYIHVGNSDKNTDGCILVGNTCNSNKVGDGFIGDSKKAFEQFYGMVKEELTAGHTVTISVEDEKVIG